MRGSGGGDKLEYTIEDMGTDVKVNSDYYLSMDETDFVVRVYNLLNTFILDRTLGRVQYVIVRFVRKLWDTHLLKLTYKLNDDELEVYVEFDYTDVDNFCIYNGSVH